MRNVALSLTLIAIAVLSGLSTFAIAKPSPIVAFPDCCSYTDGRSGSVCATCRTPECCHRVCDGYCTGRTDNINCNAGC